jgi:hypothetical protein
MSDVSARLFKAEFWTGSAHACNVRAMPIEAKQRHGTAYAGLDFIKAAFCPLEFNAIPLREHPHWLHLGRDKALAKLEVASPLTYPRQFPYTDRNGHRKIGTQVVTAAFGLAPKDFDMFLGLFTYLKRLPELPADGKTYLTVDFLAKQLGLPADGQASYQRIRSRLFRFSYVKYTNSAFWNREQQTYDIKNFGFYNLGGMSRLTESRRPITLEWDRSFLDIVRDGTLLTFNYELYRTLASAMRRLYLIANRDGWNQRDGSVFLADDFAIHQIGYDEKPELQKVRLFKLKKLLASAEDLGIIRPYAPWGGYLARLTHGHDAGKLALRWSRGPTLRTKAGDDDRRVFTDWIENDALYAQVKELHDDHGKSCAPDVYRRLVAKFGRDIMQKQVVVVLAQKEHHPGQFTKSELAAFINRCQHDHPEPDWFRDLRRAERVAKFDRVEPNQLSMNIYDTFFRG